MIKYLNGNLLDSDCDVICHGCNCFHAMNSGIAREIRSTYPESYSADVSDSIKGDKKKLGDFTFAKTKHKSLDKDVIVSNCYTQYNYGGNQINGDYIAIKKVMQKIKDTFPTQKIGMNKIGCGLGGLSWNKVESIINSVFGNREVYVYIFNPNQPNVYHSEVKALNSKYTEFLNKSNG